jgi:RNA polymerase sigma factor (sigma-70 family)
MFHQSTAAPGRGKVQDEALARRRRELGRCVRAAATGDQRGWDDLVTRMDRILRAIVRQYRLGPAESEDVLQAVWLRAFVYLPQLNDPEAVSGWLCATARREALRALQRGVTEILTDDPPAVSVSGDEAELALIEAERRDAVRRAVRRLRGRRRLLMEALLSDPPPSYERISHELEMPMGSIGPTRERALQQLRLDPELAGVIV